MGLIASQGRFNLLMETRSKLDEEARRKAQEIFEASAPKIDKIEEEEEESVQENPTPQPEANNEQILANHGVKIHRSKHRSKH